MCALVHVVAVTGLMVGFGVAGYTGIIERGWAATQPREDTQMTKKMEKNMSDELTLEQMEHVGGGANPRVWREVVRAWKELIEEW